MSRAAALDTLDVNVLKITDQRAIVSARREDIRTLACESRAKMARLAGHRLRMLDVISDIITLIGICCIIAVIIFAWRFR